MIEKFIDRAIPSCVLFQVLQQGLDGPVYGNAELLRVLAQAGYKYLGCLVACDGATHTLWQQIGNQAGVETTWRETDQVRLIY